MEPDLYTRATGTAFPLGDKFSHIADSRYHFLPIAIDLPPTLASIDHPLPALLLGNKFLITLIPTLELLDVGIPERAMPGI